VHNHKNENETANTMIHGGANSAMIHPIQVELHRHSYTPEPKDTRKHIWIELYYNPDSTTSPKRMIARPITTAEAGAGAGAGASHLLNDSTTHDGFYPESHLLD